MGQSVHAFDLKMRTIFWNAMAEKQFRYTAEEAVGQNLINVMVDDQDAAFAMNQDAAFAMNIAQRCFNGESWTGEFPVRSKSGHRFSVVTTCSPFYDDAGSPLLASFLSQLIQAAIASKISDLACKVSNKVMSKMLAGDFGAALSEQRDDALSSGASIQSGNFIYAPFGVFSCDESIPTSKAVHEVSKGRPTNSLWPCVHDDQGKHKSHKNFESDSSDSNKSTSNKGSSLWSSPNSTNRSSSSSCKSINNSVMNKVDTNSDCLEYEILWDDLTVGEEIGQAVCMIVSKRCQPLPTAKAAFAGGSGETSSCGTVYRGLWFGSGVAVKVFSKEEYSEEVIQSFRQEVALMKRLRHPNVLLFMGAVTSPQRLCIVSELLPRGSLFQLLQKKTSKLDWRWRIHMALDIARGMNYLHCCSPPIVHRDLKSSNLLVDRNLTVKVADFGLSRVKHETYLTTKSGKGTPQWMAPEVLRNESADEKSDIYSFGVVLGELATEMIPWETLNSMQVIGAVGFMNQRLEIPKDIDPLWVSLMESCWHSDAKLRPTFQELTERLRDLQRKYTIQFQATHAALLDNSLKDN
uniref:non-specific serine/threonine protein kinase n=1 Tax=Brassica oleracea var. oleracea TaxID=109376 RepID=A0A0D3BA04_BRAOL